MNLSGEPILCKTLHNPFLSTVSKAFVRSMKVNPHTVPDISPAAGGQRKSCPLCLVQLGSRTDFLAENQCHQHAQTASATRLEPLSFQQLRAGRFHGGYHTMNGPPYVCKDAQCWNS